MKRGVANIDSKLLNFEEKQIGMDIAQEVIFKDESDLFKKVITGDESCVYGYDIETKADMEMKEKPKQELLTIPKSALQKCFENGKKNVGISVLYLRGITLKCGGWMDGH